MVKSFENKLNDLIHEIIDHSMRSTSLVPKRGKQTFC